MSRFLEGEKVFLRNFSKTDVPVWYDWFNNPLVTEHMNKGNFPNTEPAQEDFFQSLGKSRSDVQLAVVAKQNDQLVGSVGIHGIDWIHRHGDISVVIGDAQYWGRGFATEAVALITRHAFTKLNLHKLTAGAWASNDGSRRCFEKNGFILEGTYREHYFHKGTYIDCYRLGLLRADWENLIKDE